MVIPYTKEGEDLRTVLENDENKRIAIAKIKGGLIAEVLRQLILLQN